MIVLQLSVLPNRQHFRWEGTLGVAEDQAGLAEGGSVILLWMF